MASHTKARDGSSPAETDQPKAEESEVSSSNGGVAGSDLGGTGSEGVDISEDYQKQAHAITHKASKHELSHLRSKMNNREDEIRQSEQDEIAKDQKSGPKEFSSSDMPS